MKKLKNLVVTLGVSASLVTGFTFIAPTQKVSAADKSQVNLWAGEDFKSTRAIYVFPGELLGVYAKNTDNVDGSDVYFEVPGTNIGGDLTYGNQTYNRRVSVAPGWYRLNLHCLDHRSCNANGVISSAR
ncbi:hypothetical protein [Bacillus arachidis]|uniref:hypothetical protein n=1 Tax=Bacillus arachidis TaxID=2819290 RepID=UPI00255C5CA7|nr:hypothetical protein [Bacillus arachidis]WIY62121.1 hypothetical protein QRY57_06325 [Bacillus arachidis]